jgi:hypothetical protein
MSDIHQSEWCEPEKVFAGMLLIGMILAVAISVYKYF